MVDFRVRPNGPEYSAYLEPRLVQIAADTHGSFGAYRAPRDTLESFIDQMDDAGIDIGVVAARSRAATRSDWPYTRKVVADAIEAKPDRLVGLIGLDVGDVPRACEEVRVAIAGSEPFIGVSFDPFQLNSGADNPELLPIYDVCAELGCIVAITLGGLPGVPAELRCSSPLAIDAVAQKFRDLTIVASHAGWPFSYEMVAVAWRNANVYFENSFYHHAPGTHVLVEAANEMIPKKMLYASAYPFAPMAETLAQFKRMPFAPDVLADILWANPLQVIDATRARLGK